MQFFKPAAIFFIMKGIFKEKYPSMIQWLDSLSQITNFNSPESSIFVADEMIIFGKSLDFLREKKLAGNIVVVARKLG